MNDLAKHHTNTIVKTPRPLDGYEWGNAASSHNPLLSAYVTVTTTGEFVGGESALHPTLRLERRLHDENWPLATLSITKGTTAAPLLCCVVVSLRVDSVAAPYFQAGDIDANLIALAQRYLICQQARSEPSPQLAQGWSEFYQECQSVVIRTIRDCGVYGAELEDCSQEAWQRISQALIHFVYDPIRGRFCDWLAVVVRREVYRSCQRRIARAVHEQRMMEMNIATNMLEDPVINCQRRELQKHIGEALTIFQGRISVTNYRIVQGYWLKGLSLTEIAGQIGLTYEQVRWRHQRLRRKLHDALKPLVMEPE